MFIKKLCDDFFKVNGFRIHLTLSDTFNSDGIEPKVYYSTMESRLPDGENVSVARDKFALVLRANGVKSRDIVEAFVLDADGIGIPSHARGAKRIRQEYENSPKMVLYALSQKLEALSGKLYDAYMDDAPLTRQAVMNELRDAAEKADHIQN